MANDMYCPFHSIYGGDFKELFCDQKDCAIWDEKRECCSFKTTQGGLKNYTDSNTISPKKSDG